MKLDSFEITELELPGVLLIKPRVWNDERGSTVNTYSVEELERSRIINTSFVQDLTSCSRKNVLRGLHFQNTPHSQAKLVRCSSGEIFDVATDYNQDSSTFGQYVSAILRGDEQTLLYIPAQYAHGFCVLSEDAVVEYKLSNAYNRDAVNGVRYDDPALNIDWPITNPILSEQDKSWPSINSRQL